MGLSFDLVLAFLVFSMFANATTVQQVLDGRSCSTVGVAGLSRQLVVVANKTKPGLWTDIARAPFDKCVSLSSAAAAVPFLQHGAAASLCSISSKRGERVGINSGLRSLAQQLLLYLWWKEGLCGITEAVRMVSGCREEGLSHFLFAQAPPGQSNHNGGAAVDIDDSSGWRSYFLSHGWSWQGSGDPAHYNWNAAVDVRKGSVVAFQQLWNLNNPNHKISVDGLYGPATQAALLQSPAQGFNKVP